STLYKNAATQTERR
nr:Chain B, Protein panoramix [Drosophila melanogaster]